MSTSERNRQGSSAGVGMVEVLVGLALTVVLAAALAPLMVSLDRLGVDSADRSVQALQSRVAVARFDRDLRLAGGRGCPFPTSSALLEASSGRVVLLVRQQEGEPPLIVAWEIAGSSLMRRWVPAPPARPQSYDSSLFRDNKTMLEGVRSGSKFSYLCRGVPVSPAANARLLSQIDGVAVELVLAPTGLGHPENTRAIGSVAR